MNNVLRFTSKGKKSVSLCLSEKPSDITVNVLNGKEMVPFSSTWDAAGKILVLDFEDSKNSLDVEIKW